MKLPEKSYINKLIPKAMISRYLSGDSRLQKIFSDEVDSIVWTNTLSTDTIFIQRGKYVKDIKLIEINVKRQAINPEIIKIIQQKIFEYVIIIVRYEEWAQVWGVDIISPEESEQEYYVSIWQNYDGLEYDLEGADFDQVYLSFIRWITEKNVDNNDIQMMKKKQLGDKVRYFDFTNKEKELEVRIKELENRINESNEFRDKVESSIEINKLKMRLEKMQKESYKSQSNWQEKNKKQNTNTEIVKVLNFDAFAVRYNQITINVMEG